METQIVPQPTLERIAAALERIADAIEPSEPGDVRLKLFNLLDDIAAIKDELPVIADRLTDIAIQIGGLQQ